MTGRGDGESDGRQIHLRLDNNIGAILLSYTTKIYKSGWSVTRENMLKMKPIACCPTSASKIKCIKIPIFWGHGSQYLISFPNGVSIRFYVMAIFLSYTCFGVDFRLAVQMQKLLCIYFVFLQLTSVIRIALFSFQKPQEDKYAAAPWLIGLFVFVVCGSGECLHSFLNRQLC